MQVRSPNGASWQKEAAWPLPKTQWDRYYLDAGDGGMDPAKEGAAAAEKSYGAMSDGVTFTTEPFASDVNFTGPAMLKLWVRSSTADMDIFATLRLIDPEGRDVTFMGNSNPRVPLNEGLLRVSQRAVDPAKSTQYQVYRPHVAVEPMSPIAISPYLMLLCDETGRVLIRDPLPTERLAPAQRKRTTECQKIYKNSKNDTYRVDNFPKYRLM